MLAGSGAGPQHQGDAAAAPMGTSWAAGTARGSWRAADISSSRLHRQAKVRDAVCSCSCYKRSIAIL